MAYTLSVDKNKCIGCGTCAAVCPGSFEMRNGKSSPKKKIVDKITCEKEAEESCPVQAITIKEVKK